VQAPSPAPSDPQSGAASPAPAVVDAYNLSPDETTRRLRAKGQPVRLFGEAERARRLRLRALELIEEQASARTGGQNDFRRALAEVESRERERHAAGRGARREDPARAAAVLDLALFRTDKQRLYPLIYHALKRILKEWEEAMDDRPEHVKRTTQGKLAAATQKQSAEYLKPLFKNLRSKVRQRARTAPGEAPDPVARTCPTTCSAASRRSCTTRRRRSTSARTTRTCVSPSATRPGPSA
jgi:pre-mRNA-splicing factor 18